MIEREFKFLPNPNSLYYIQSLKPRATNIKQGYLMLGENGKQLRIRLKENRAFICFKYKISDYEKDEFEFEIPYSEGIELYEKSYLQLEKLRYTEVAKDMVIDIDYYVNGIIVIEVEHSQNITKDDIRKLYFIGEDITGNPRYSNILLANKNIGGV